MPEDTDTTTWDEQRERAHITGEKSPIDETTMRQIERRREGQ